MNFADFGERCLFPGSDAAPDRIFLAVPVG